MIISILGVEELDISTKIFLIVCIPLVVLFSLSIHEYAHAVVSYALGDPTAKSRGRLTLNPFKHLNPLGTLCMLLFGFGWARPVPIDVRYYKEPKKGMALCGLAGPAINAVIGISTFSMYSIMCWGAERLALDAIGVIIPDWLYVALAHIFYIIGYYNILLAVFNLIPIPPLDGSRLLYAFLPDKQYFAVMKYERIIMFVMLALLWIGIFDVLFDAVLTLSMNCISTLVYSVMDMILKLVVG